MRKHLKLTHAISTQKKKTDLSLLLVVVILSIFGLVFVFDSSAAQAYSQFQDKYYFIKQQVIWVMLGFLGLGFFSIFDYHNLKKLSWPIFLISFVLLLAVFIPGLGVVAGGAHRWLKLGPLTIQPAEIIKLSCIILFAAIFETRRQAGRFLLILVTVSLVLGGLQKDLGSTIVFFLTSALTFILAGVPLMYLWVSLPVIIVGFLGFILGSTYRRQRVLAFLDPFSDPRGYSYHISQVLIALGSGGWFGLGLGQSRQKYSFIPEVTTDSIFSIVGEELGFLGASILILLISFVIYRAFTISEAAKDDFGKFLGLGLTFWLGIQAALNLAAMVSLVPLTGVPLPFISYGGSALLANLVAVGILLNISKQANL